MRVRRLLYWTLVASVALSLTLALPVYSEAASIGTARGIRAVELTLDGGKSWLPMGGVSMPILDGTQIRSRTGGAAVDFTDGSRINVLPFSAVTFREAANGAQVSLVYGRVTFQLPAEAQVEFRSPSARLEPVKGPGVAGELFVGTEGTTGLKMSRGNLRVEEIGGAHRSLMASLEPVFLPRRPATSGPLFTTDASAEGPAAGAKAVFSAEGQSLGFIKPNKQLVVHPGYTADLTQRFSAKTIQLALAQVPQTDRSDATPVFDVNGGYAGYLIGPVFHAQGVGTSPQQTPAGQVQIAQDGGASGAGAGDGTGINPFWVAGGMFAVPGGVIGGLCWEGEWPSQCQGNGGSAGPATPLRPLR
jgi:hypothetical protein